IAARARLVLDDELLTGQLGELVADDAGERVGRPARRKDIDVAHRLVGPVVGRARDPRIDPWGGKRSGRQRERAAAGQRNSTTNHKTKPPLTFTLCAL